MRLRQQPGDFGRSSDDGWKGLHKKTSMTFALRRELLPVTTSNENNVRLIVNRNRKEMGLFWKSITRRCAIIVASTKRLFFTEKTNSNPSTTHITQGNSGLSNDLLHIFPTSVNSTRGRSYQKKLEQNKARISCCWTNSVLNIAKTVSLSVLIEKSKINRLIEIMQLNFDGLWWPTECLLRKMKCEAAQVQETRSVKHTRVFEAFVVHKTSHRTSMMSLSKVVFSRQRFQHQRDELHLGTINEANSW